jgi:hypothetical protein
VASPVERAVLARPVSSPQALLPEQQASPVEPRAALVDE